MSAPTGSPATTAPDDRPARGRLPRYALWQARDYALERGVPSLLVGALLAWQVRLSLRAAPELGQVSEATALQVYALLLGPLGFFVTLLGTNGIVSTDRTQGYFRLLFARPIRPTRYYLQAFLVHWIGCLAAAAMVLALVGLALGRPAPPRTLTFIALYYLALGGIVFLASALARFDWLIAGVLWSTPDLIHPLALGGRDAWARLLDPLLPPTYVIDDVISAMMGGGRVPMGPAIHLLGYGAACLALGLLVVRRRPMAA